MTQYVLVRTNKRIFGLLFRSLIKRFFFLLENGSESLAPDLKLKFATLWMPRFASRRSRSRSRFQHTPGPMALTLRVLIVFAALTKCGNREKNDDHFLITFFYFLYAVVTHILEHNLRLVFPHTRPVMEGCSDATCLNIKEGHLSMKDSQFFFLVFFSNRCRLIRWKNRDESGTMEAKQSK